MAKKFLNQIDMSTNKIINLGAPSADTDAANKKYIDDLIAGRETKQSVRVASTANLTLSGAQTIDGVSAIAGDRVLVKNQTTPAQNGIYVVAAGSWQRSSDADTWAELISALAIVEEGTTLKEKAFLCTIDAGGTLGSTAINFVSFGDGASYTAGAATDITSNVISTKYNNTNIGVNGSNQLEIKSGSITATEIATGAITSTGILDGTILNADINASAAISLSKLAVDPLARANHTGTQLSTTISDFASATAAFSKYHDVTASSVTGTVSVTSAPSTVGGTTMTAGDRVFIGGTSQAAADRGIWIWNSLGAAMTRPTDWASGSTRTVGEAIGVRSFSTIYILATQHVVGSGTAASYTALAATPSGVAGGALTGTYPSPTLAADSVSSSNIVDGTIVAADLASDSVTTVKILNSNVTAAKLATGAVDLTTTTVTGLLPVASGGTGANNALSARTNLATLSKVSAVSAASTTTTISSGTLASAGILNVVISVTIIEASTGDFVEADVNFSSGALTVTFGSAVAASAYTIYAIGY